MIQSCANLLLEDDDARLGLSKADKKKFIEEVLKEFYNNDNPYDYIGDE